jgi:hypothetical protein
VSLEEQQLQMLRRMATLDPPPCFMGGYAEDALLAGTLTRAHEDFDWRLPRRELELRTAQAKRLGFSGFETWGEAAPGEPFYLYAENGGLKLDLGIADEERSSLWIKVHRLSFTVDGKEAPAGYRRSRAGSRGISTTPMIAGVIWGPRTDTATEPRRRASPVTLASGNPCASAQIEANARPLAATAS